ncbi:MAG: hypothetical protein HS106_00515 [Ideonella sp.]|nr:hypothetical protein [Ideonella sp.]
MQPAITQQPGNVSVTAGQTALPVIAARTGLYQWRRSNDGGQRSSMWLARDPEQFSSAAAALADDGAVLGSASVPRSGPGGVDLPFDSQAATLTVVPAAVALAFTQQPQSMAVVAGPDREP